MASHPNITNCAKSRNGKKCMPKNAQQIKVNRKNTLKMKCINGKVLLPDKKSCVDLTFIDNGEYGCAVKPPIVETEYITSNYIPYNDIDNTDIAKIFRKEKHFVEELKYLNIMQKIDENKSFTAKLKGAQQIIGKSLMQNRLLINCLRRGSYIDNTPFYQIILEYGGVKVNDKHSYKLTYVQFIECLKQFIAGLIKMQENNIVHRDIKPGNVLYKMSQNKLNLIDFGLMCAHYTELYDGNDIESMNLLEFKEYPYYPPEFYVAYIMLSYKDYYEGNKQKFDNFVDNILMNKLYNSGFFQTDTLLQNPALKREYEDGIRNFIETIKALDVTRPADIFTRDIAMKADVFAVAYIIGSLKRNITILYHDEEEFIDILYRRCIRANPYDRATFLELYSILTSEYSRSMNSFKNKSSLRIRSYSYGGAAIVQKLKNKIREKLQPYLMLTVNKIKNILDLNYPSPKRYSSPNIYADEHDKKYRHHSLNLNAHSALDFKQSATKTRRSKTYSKLKSQ
jgi:serine/threonine protein kinase